MIATAASTHTFAPFIVPRSELRRPEAQLCSSYLAQYRTCPRAAACGAVATSERTEVPNMEAVILKNGVVDYYAVLQVDDDSTEDEIKLAYRQLAKVCHPDFAGDEGHNICILLNEAYDTLMNANARRAYEAQLEVALRDEEDGYTGKALSKWGPDTRMGHRSKNDDPNETRAVFVDENSCIGCMNCVHNAPRTFRMNPLHGKARVFCQWLDEEDDLDTAIQSCPVDCIHWVEKEELPALEYVCQNVQERVQVAVLGMNGGRGGDVFAERDKFLKARKKLEDDKRKAAAKSSPLQEKARKAAAESLARERGGWWGSFSHRLKESFSTAAAGVDRDDVSSRSRVGRRRRAVNWRDVVPNQASAHTGGGDGGTIPTNLALVPVMAKVDDFSGAR